MLLASDHSIKQLYRDIQKTKTIHTNSDIFIKHNNISLHIFTKKTQLLSECDLPTQSLLGSVILIKGDNIIEFYSWCDCNYSRYIQINRTDPIWVCKTTIINIAERDPDNIRFLMDGNECMYHQDNVQYLMLQFIQDGFKLYIK